jgi:hypothetical protein
VDKAWTRPEPLTAGTHSDFKRGSVFLPIIYFTFLSLAIVLLSGLAFLLTAGLRYFLNEPTSIAIGSVPSMALVVLAIHNLWKHRNDPRIGDPEYEEWVRKRNRR